MKTPGVSVLFCLTLAGCTIRGTYVDPPQTNTAKLRFVSYAENSTLDYFDAQTCSGRTTGILNNWMLRDTERRVGMLVPPPTNARGYLELTVAADQTLVLSSNTTDSYGESCAIPIKFSFQKGAEYELTLWRNGRQCSVVLDSIKLVSGVSVRAPQVLPADAKLLGCNGVGPRFLSAPSD